VTSSSSSSSSSSESAGKKNVDMTLLQLGGSAYVQLRLIVCLRACLLVEERTPSSPATCCT
jgi:hypothetical protein